MSSMRAIISVLIGLFATLCSAQSDPDTRAEAMGLGDVAMPGDTRNMSHSPASLIELNGIEGYCRISSSDIFITHTDYTLAALAYRLSDRFAFGVRYDRTGSKYDPALNFGDMIDPARGFIYDTSVPVFYSNPAIAGSVAYKLFLGLSIGASLENIPAGIVRSNVLFGNAGLFKVFHLKQSGTWRHSVRAALSLQNVTSASIDHTYTNSNYTSRVHYLFPVVSRLGASYTIALHKGWLNDSLPSLAFTAHVQYDDVLTNKYGTAIRFGGELEVLRMLALRCGWYSVSLNDLGQPKYRKSELPAFTYGVGFRLPLALLTKGKWPVDVSVDYTSLPYQTASTSNIDPWTYKPLRNFNTCGIRLNYALGRAFKKKP